MSLDDLYPNERLAVEKKKMQFKLPAGIVFTGKIIKYTIATAAIGGVVGGALMFISGDNDQAMVSEDEGMQKVISQYERYCKPSMLAQLVVGKDPGTCRDKWQKMIAHASAIESGEAPPQNNDVIAMYQNSWRASKSNPTKKAYGW